MFKSRTGDDHTCADCLTRPPHFNSVRSAGQYDGALMKCIHALKYKRKIQLARPMGRLLFNAYIRYSELPKPDIIVPVPLHRSRLKKRGFNQAALILAQWPEFLKKAGHPVPKIADNASVLRRIKKTPAQTGLDRDSRQSNIRRAFALNSKIRNPYFWKNHTID
jgi:predicted amidophosphoribosyltransferase